MRLDNRAPLHQALQHQYDDFVVFLFFVFFTLNEKRNNQSQDFPAEWWQDLEMEVESASLEPQIPKWKSGTAGGGVGGRGADAGETANNVYSTLNFPQWMIENKTKHAFETRNTHTCVAHTHSEREKERKMLHPKYLCSHDKVNKVQKQN